MCVDVRNAISLGAPVAAALSGHFGCGTNKYVQLAAAIEALPPNGPMEHWGASKRMSVLLRLTRQQRRLLLGAMDLVLLNVALWLAMSARWGRFYVAPDWTVFGLLAAVPLIAVASFAYLRLYHYVSRHFDAVGDQLVFLGISFSTLCLGLGAFVLNAQGIPRTVLFLYPMVGTIFISISRRVIKLAITRAGITLPPSAAPGSLQNVVIYGDGQSAHDLFAAVRRSRDLEVVAFVSPDPTLWRQYISGIRVYPPERLPHLIKSHQVRQVLLATEQSPRRERLAVLGLLEESRVQVRVLPPLAEFAAGRVTVNDLRPIEVKDLLGRPPIPPDPDLMAHTVRNRCVMVTGAGGTIGSELVKQILDFQPARVVLLDAGETHLYNIENEVHANLLRRAPSEHPEVVAVLGSVVDAPLVEHALSTHNVQTVYHAAAYKHVPILQHNVVVGVHNNTIGTEVLVDAAVRSGVENFVFVSSDKAVRPASVLGASKRLGEMIVQARAAKGPATKLSIVRFGNVLDSSGSIIRRFRQQIEAGGPVTVTHPEATRYFISIPEAAALVMQAAAMSKGGDMFVLDMGAPQSILELARIMITLSGLQPRDLENPKGDIEIVFTGLRPGDKLTEELHTADSKRPTRHPRIWSVEEPLVPAERLEATMKDIKTAISENNAKAVLKALSNLVEGFNPLSCRTQPAWHNYLTR